MADPATIAMMAAKALAIMSDKENRKAIGKVVAVILSPILLIMFVIGGLGDAGASHNRAAVDICFEGGEPPDSMSEEYKGNVRNMQESFSLLDGHIGDLNAQMEDGDVLDTNWVKSIFYALFFAEDSPSVKAHGQFVDCFVVWEERTRTVEDEDGEEYEETYEVPVPLTKSITNFPGIYSSIASTMSAAVTPENQINAQEIYYRRVYGGPAPDYGELYAEWWGDMEMSNEPFVGTNGFCSPLGGAGWRSIVSSPYGWRANPTGSGTEFHTGIDLRAGTGTPMYAALDGTVYLVRSTSGGYGLHLIIDHGGGFATLYGHCSAIHVSQGQPVKAGDHIADVGNTGRSTGPHLHFEIRDNGQTRDPASYLP